MRDPETIETELMEISAIAEDAVKLERIIAWCAGHPLNFALGRRDQATTDAFIEGLRQAMAPQRFQITTDGFQPYKSAITTTLSDRADFGMLIKVYAQDPEGERRYSPAEVVDATP